MKYKIITQHSYSLLEREVNNLLEGGWRVQGNVIYNHRSEIYIQTMIKKDKSYKNIFKELKNVQVD